MSLDSLTTSGWTLLVVSLKSDAARIIIAKQMGASGLLLIVQLLWLRWLVSP